MGGAERQYGPRRRVWLVGLLTMSARLMLPRIVAHKGTRALVGLCVLVSLSACVLPPPPPPPIPVHPMHPGPH